MEPRRAQRAPEDDEGTGYADRLLAAVLAPIAFNISNLIMIACLFRRSSSGIGRFIVNDLPMLGDFLLWGLFIIPAVVGFLVGMDRLILLIGHLFLTHSESERDGRITLAAWFGLILSAYLLSHALG